jgi:hypothetical protein
MCDVAIELGAVVISGRIIKERLDLNTTLATDVCRQRNELMLLELGCTCK